MIKFHKIASKSTKNCKILFCPFHFIDHKYRILFFSPLSMIYKETLLFSASC